MAFRRDKSVDSGEVDVDAEIMIDAEIADDAAADAGSLPVPRSKALPEAKELRAIEARREGDIAIRNVAVATAGGIAAGAATVVIARTVQKLAKPTPGLARRRRSDIVASRSFMVDVHMLKPQR